jgi:hypothetical protein
MIFVVPASFVNPKRFTNSMSQIEIDNAINELNRDYFTLQRINYSIPRNKKCAMEIAINNRNHYNIDKRKLVISFGGNAMNARDMIFGFLQSNANNSRRHKVCDFLAVDWPAYATTSEQLVNAGVSAVVRAIKAGYKPENISIAGHSLGGAVSAKVLEKMKQYPDIMKNQKFAGYVNHRSFTKLGDVKGGSFVNLIARIFSVQLDAESALQQDNLPVSQMKFYADNKDTVIKTEASIANKVQHGQIIEKIPTKVKITPSCGHSSDFANSLFKPSSSHMLWKSPPQGWRQFNENQNNQKYVETKTINV